MGLIFVLRAGEFNPILSNIHLVVVSSHLFTIFANVKDFVNTDELHEKCTRRTTK